MGVSLVGLMLCYYRFLGGGEGGFYLGTPKVQDEDVEGGEDDEDDVEFPLDAREGRGGSFDVDDGGEEGADNGPGHALRADVGGEDFTWFGARGQIFSFLVERFLFGITQRKKEGIFTAVDIGCGIAATAVEGDEAESEEDAHGVAGVVGGSGVPRYHGGFEDEGAHAAA